MDLNLNQTLQNKYPHLEVSVLKYSDAMKDNDSKRIDSVYFMNKYLLNDKEISDFIPLRNIAIIKSGTTPKDRDENLKSGVILLKTNNIRNNVLSNSDDYFYIDENTNLKMKSTQLKQGDVLINIVGATTDVIGRIAYIPNNFEKANITQAMAFLRIKNSDFLSGFLFIALQCNNTKLQIERLARPTGQFNLNLEEVKQIKIPLFPLEFQQQIEQMVRESHECLEQSKGLYREAEVLLYRELGLDPENPLASIETHSGSLNISVRPLSQSLNTTGRLDSEYYQQKYDEIEKVIKNYRGGYFQLSLFELRDKNFTPQAQTKYRYIELANIGTNGNISEPIVDFGENLPSRARRIVKTGDMIISSIEGSLQSCALITDEFNNCIVSTGFYVLKSSNLNSETLLVLFKSKLFQDYLHKFSNGTILTAISKDELQNIVIPKIAIETQTQIAEKIKQSFALRKKASELLQTAKQSVETAIEKG